MTLFPFIDYWWIYAGFTAFVLGMLALDLGVFHKKCHEVSVKEASVWTALWICLALVFNFLFYLYAKFQFATNERYTSIPGFDPEAQAQTSALEFLTGFVVDPAAGLAFGTGRPNAQTTLYLADTLKIPNHPEQTRLRQFVRYHSPQNYLSFRNGGLDGSRREPGQGNGGLDRLEYAASRRRSFFRRDRIHGPTFPGNRRRSLFTGCARGEDQDETEKKLLHGKARLPPVSPASSYWLIPNFRRASNTCFQLGILPPFFSGEGPESIKVTLRPFEMEKCNEPASLRRVKGRGGTALLRTSKR